jgi:hypothetical protein
MMTANPGDNWLEPGLVNSDGESHNLYYTTGDDNYGRYYVKLLVHGGTYSVPTIPTSWLANFYIDTQYQWLEVMIKSTSVVRGNSGPYNAVDVSQTASTTSQVWRGDLNGQNWVYLGNGSITTTTCP